MGILREVFEFQNNSVNFRNIHDGTWEGKSANFHANMENFCEHHHLLELQRSLWTSRKFCKLLEIFAKCAHFEEILEISKKSANFRKNCELQKNSANFRVVCKLQEDSVNFRQIIETVTKSVNLTNFLRNSGKSVNLKNILRTSGKFVKFQDDSSYYWEVLGRTSWKSELPAKNFISQNFLEFSSNLQTFQKFPKVCIILSCLRTSLKFDNSVGFLDDWNCILEMEIYHHGKFSRFAMKKFIIE